MDSKMSLRAYLVSLGIMCAPFTIVTQLMLLLLSPHQSAQAGKRLQHLNISR